MGVFVRAVVYGFGFSLGAALFKRVSSQLGFEETQPAAAQTSADAASDGDPDNDDGGTDAAHAPA
jgi:hypothetical protein